MAPTELRNPDDAKRFLLQGLWFQRAVSPTAATVRPILEWAFEISNGGEPLLPTNVIADVGQIALGLDRETGTTRKEQLVVPGFPPGLARTYEDHVLGKLYADWTFERAGDALRRYHGPEQKRDRARGLAYILKQLRERGGFPSVEVSTALLRSLLEAPPDDLLAQSWEQLSRDGPIPLLPAMIDSLIGAVRRMAEVLAIEDIIALEQRTALAELGQYVAHRQILQVARRLEEGLPKQKVRPLVGRQEVPTRVLDEDTYPVGGFSSISNRGSIESLLHSQLAFMEPDSTQQPDLFDVKFLRDELYFYSRDENQFLRRRRTFVLVLLSDLVQARFKDTELPCQRIVLTLSLIVALIRRLIDWLSLDAIRFEIVFLTDGKANPLAHESNLLEMLHRELIENETLAILEMSSLSQAEAHYQIRARRSMVHAVTIGVVPPLLRSDGIVTTRLQIAGPRPGIGEGDRPLQSLEGEDLLESWILTLERLLQLWI